MTLLARIIAARRLTLFGFFSLSLVGLAGWFGMPRQEDPPVANTRAMIVVPFPGADPIAVERQVLEPLEEELSQIEEIAHIDSKVRAGVAVVVVELRPTSDPERLWDEVSRSLEAARREFPAGVGAPRFERRYYDQEAVILAVSGPGDRIALSEAAHRLRRALLAVPSVARVKRIGDPEPIIAVELDPSVADRLGLTPASLARQLAARTSATPGGRVELDGRVVALRAEAEVARLDELERLPIALGDGSSLPLGTIAEVRREPNPVGDSLMRLDGHDVVGLGIVPHEGIDRIRFGEAVRAAVESVRGELAPFAIREVAYQPRWVGARVDGLVSNLLWGIAIVTGLLFLFMSPRLGTVVAIVLPVTVLSSLAVYAAGGGIVHQVSIAALVIAIGMLVDNGIVVAESIQTRLDAGVPPLEAAVDTIRWLWAPLASSTGTTMAAFLPMLLAEGSVADFTRAIPTVLILSLGMSYVVAVLFTPVLAAMVLRPGQHLTGNRMIGAIVRGAEAAVRRPLGATLVAGALLVAAIALAPSLTLRFFPTTDRNELLVDIELPEGATLESTREAVAELEERVAKDARVVSVASFVGSGAPRFYYNIAPLPGVPHRATLLVRTRTLDDVPRMVAAIDRLAERLPEMWIVPKTIEQGPPVLAPIEVRLFGDDLGKLELAAGRVLATVRSHPGVRHVRTTLGIGTPTLRLGVRDVLATRFGTARGDLARSAFGRTLGLPAGDLRGFGDPERILVRGPGGDTIEADALAALATSNGAGSGIRLDQVASPVAEWQPAGFTHRDGRRTVSVLAQLREGRTTAEVMRTLKPAIRSLALVPGVTTDIGGDTETAGDANRALRTTAPLAFVLLIAMLLVEFNSFRRAAIVLVTIPLAVVGVVPALFLSGSPFSFFALLGTFALVGIVVNNAIILIDLADQRCREGWPVRRATLDAVRERTRPILLTTGTTIVGLLPLAFDASDLWPPMAWTLIGGMISSTLLGLFVVPILYVVAVGGFGALRESLGN